MLLAEAANSMNCSVLCTIPLSSRYCSLRRRCDFASVPEYQLPLRLNSQPDASSFYISTSISARAAGDRVAALATAAARQTIRPVRRRRIYSSHSIGRMDKNSTLKRFHPSVSGS